MSSKLENALTVGQLIEKLSKLDPSLPVVGEGCDCVNVVIGVTEDIWPLHPSTDSLPYVLINVKNGVESY